MFVYILCDSDSNVVKVGVTRGQVFNRLSQINTQQNNYSFAVYGAKAFDLQAAQRLEKELLNYLSVNFKGVPYYFGGSTECYIVHDVISVCSMLWNIIDNYKNTDVVVPSESVCRVVGSVSICLQDFSRCNNISLTDFIVLSTLKQYGDLSQQQIANDLCISTKTVERCIKSLESAGYLSVFKNKVQGGVYRNEYKLEEKLK